VPSTQPITSKVTIPLPGSQTLASLRVAQFSPSVRFVSRASHECVDI
jgi:hypothetical protein